MPAQPQHLAPTAAHTFLNALPDKIKQAIITYAEEMEYPVEAVLEIAISGFLDPESISFADCQPMTGRERDFGRLAS